MQQQRQPPRPERMLHDELCPAAVMTSAQLHRDPLDLTQVTKQES
jgi:hypothetical protein